MSRKLHRAADGAADGAAGSAVGTPTQVLHVVIPTFGRAELLDRTLATLAAATIPAALGSVVVVENGPEGAAASISANAADLAVTYLHTPESGKGRALNVALDHLGDGWILCFDDDVRIGPGTLEAYATAIGTGPTDRILGGPVHVDQEGQPPPWLEPFLPASVTGWSGPTEGDDGDHRFVLGANIAVHTDALRSVGGFPVDRGPGAFVPGTEGNPVGMERELQARLLDHGASIEFVADGEVWHHVPPERCSPAWALHRERRRYIDVGLRELTDATPAARRRHLATTVLALLRGLGAVAASSLHRDPATRHRGRRVLERAIGLLQAHRLSRP